MGGGGGGKEVNGGGRRLEVAGGRATSQADSAFPMPVLSKRILPSRDTEFKDG